MRAMKTEEYEESLAKWEGEYLNRNGLVKCSRCKEIKLEHQSKCGACIDCVLSALAEYDL